MKIRIPKYTLVAFLTLLSLNIVAQDKAKHWVDSVFKKLSKDERIAQLMVVRLSTYDSKTKKVTFFDEQVTNLVKKYNIGGVCLFQGSPTKQTQLVNDLQAIARTPIMMCIDAEWGLGMRMIDSILPLPKQMMLGAIKDPKIVYEYGKLVAEQCRRVGIHVNYAPVVDVNNNPANPVINDRSFGENKNKVADFGIAYMRGMQDQGVLACAKHFPGHGDVSVDSHYDLPVINKSIDQLDSLELYPFRKIFESGIGSVMIAHLSIPSVDNRANRPTSISASNIKELLRSKIGFQGITFTDALEMQGVKKYFPDGEASVESIIAGNDMLCLPGDVPLSIEKIKKAIKAKHLSWADIEFHCKRVLMAKYQYVVHHTQPASLVNVAADLNAKVPAMRKLVAENAITLVTKTNPLFFPLTNAYNHQKGDLAYLGIGINGDNEFAKRMKQGYNADVFFMDYSAKSETEISNIIHNLKTNYKRVVIGVHNTTRSAATNFGISKDAVQVVNSLQQTGNTFTFLFANAYAAAKFCDAKNLAVCYEDDDIVQGVAVDLLEGKIQYNGKLPVTVCQNFPAGTGIATVARHLRFAPSYMLGFNEIELAKIDSIATNAIEKKAIPGCVIMVLKDGKIAYNKAFGHLDYSENGHITPETVYDMASVTKICATTISVMKLYEEGKIDINKTLGDYLPWVQGSGKGALSLKRVLLHQAGLVAYIPFYKEWMNADGSMLEPPFGTTNAANQIQVADKLFLNSTYNDTMFKRILSSPLGAIDKYVYSDNDFIFLGKIVEAVSGMPLDDYANKNFYSPMGLSTIGFNPLKRIEKSVIAPTENEKSFRRQLIHGYVHDPGAAMFGGVSGHAGLFSNAYDIASIMQMLLDKGVFNGKRFLKEETIELFTAYQSPISRRGYGFDKPEKDNATRKDPYPGTFVSPKTFGHTGFTGTCTWADPENHIVYVFLGNRVNAENQSLFLKMNVRSTIHDQIYKALATSPL